MKPQFHILIIFALLATSCAKHKGFTISGKITNADGKFLYLDELKVASSVPIDSVKLGNDGNFKFEGHESYPNFYLLRLNENDFLTLLADTTENIRVFGDAANFSRDYKVEGSPGSSLVQELNKMLTKTKHKLDSIQTLIKSFRNRAEYEVQKAAWNQQLTDIKQSQIRYSTNFVQKHPFSMASVLALYQKFDDSNYVVQDLQSLKVAASALNSIYPKSEHVRALYQNTQNLMLQEKNVKLQDFIDKNGVNYPDITLPDYTGKKISLSSLKSKVILIQFWSAFDKGSRIQNEALVDLYAKYRSQGLEIYQVSVDTARNAWLDAIETDGLKWINVGDMKGSAAAVHAYNIQSLPGNYILDKNRRIAAKDLQGPELDKAIAILLK